jgi:hypothetical protein
MSLCSATSAGVALIFFFIDTREREREELFLNLVGMAQSVAELKQSLVATTLELEAAREELRRKEQSIAKLADLVRQVAKDRDDARDQLQQQLLLAAAPPRLTSSVTDSDCSLVSSPVDPFFDPVTSADKRKPATPLPAGSAAGAVLDMLASKRPLPQKGRLLAAVMEAGPLLQNLLVAGQLPRWRNPPTVHALARAGYVGAPPVAMGYGAASACTKRPAVSMLPLTPMAAANCSPGFVAKRVRLH